MCGIIVRCPQRTITYTEHFMVSAPGGPLPSADNYVRWALYDGAPG